MSRKSILGLFGFFLFSIFYTKMRISAGDACSLLYALAVYYMHCIV